MLNTVAPSYPLSLSAFRQALAVGHGRALWHVREHGVVEMRDALLEAVTHSLVFDSQCEPSRAAWLVELIEAADLLERALAVLTAATKEPDKAEFTGADRGQQINIAVLLAKHCVPKASELAYSLLKRQEARCLLGECAKSLIEIDGAAGLIFIARQEGLALADEVDYFVDNHALRVFDERFGQEQGRSILEKAAANDSAIARYLGFLQGRGAFRPTNHDPPPQRRPEIRRNVAEVIEAIARGERLPGADWGLEASDGDKELLFQALLRETDVGRIMRFLGCFGRAGPPRFDEKLLQWLDSDVRGLPNAAINVLSHLSDPRVRELALARLATGRLHDGISLLRSTYRPSDHRLFERLLVPLSDKNELHGLMSPILELFEKNRVVEGTPAVLFVYEQSPCMNCRFDAVWLLMRLGTAPSWLIEECALDADLAIRSLIQNGPSDSWEGRMDFLNV